jgi:hypothetical protein
MSDLSFLVTSALSVVVVEIAFEAFPSPNGLFFSAVIIQSSGFNI